MIKKLYCKTLFEDFNQPFRFINFNAIDYFIYIPLVKSKYLKEEPDIFWHMSSIGKDEYEEQDDGDLLMCANTIHQSSCGCKCKKREDILPDGRIPCLFRAESISLLPKLIEMYQSGNKLVNTWEYDGRLYIRSYIGNFDYVAIFVPQQTFCNGKRRLLLLTAFPVVLYSYKKRYDRQFTEYQENKNA